MAVNDFDYFNRGEPLPTGSGTASTTAFDYFNRGEVFPAGITVASGASSFSATASGGMTLGSSATVKPTYIYVASGGLVAGSTDTVKPTYLYVASGGLVAGGTDTVVPRYLYSGSGGLVAGSTDTVVPTYLYNGSGLLSAGGTATASGNSQFSYTASGGLVAGGVASFVGGSGSYTYTASGNLSLGSTAPAKAFYPTVVGSGLLSTSNGAGYKLKFIRSTSGKAALANSAGVTTSYLYPTQLNLSFGQSAFVQPTYVYVASGGLSLQSPVVTGSPPHILLPSGGSSSGGLVLGGSGPASLRFDYEASGGLTTDGDPIYQPLYIYPAIMRRRRIVRSRTAATMTKAPWLYDASGGLNLSGASAVRSPTTMDASGGAVLGGSADVVVNPPPYIYAAGGSLSTGGAAPAQLLFTPTGSGGLNLTGAIRDPKSVDASGGASLGGAAAVTFMPNGPVTASGGLAFGGSSPADYVVYIIGPDPGLVSLGGSADYVCSYHEYTGGGSLSTAGAIDQPKLTQVAFGSGSLATGNAAVASITFVYAASGGLTLVGRAAASFDYDFDKTFTWAISEGVLRTFRVEGKCRPLNAKCPPTYDPAPACGTGNTMQYALNIQAHSAADLCQRLKKRGLTGPIKRIQMWSLPVNKSDWGPNDRADCNTLADVEFDLPECLDLTIDLTVEEGIKASCEIEDVPAAFTYEASGVIGLPGVRANVISPYYAYAGSGSVVASGTVSTFCPQYQQASAGGGIGFGGSAAAWCSHIGDIVCSIRSSSAVADVGVDFGFVPADTLVASTSPVPATCCANLNLPPIMYIMHDLNRSDVIKRFLKVNGFTLPPVLKMTYSQRRNTWYSNVHYNGISVTNRRQMLDMVFEFGCMSEDSVVGVSQNVWGFSILVRSKNVDDYRFDSTRLLLEFDPVTVCEISGNLKFDFTFNLKTQTSQPPIVRTALFADYLGVFKNSSYTSNPNAVFEVAVNPPQASPGAFDQSAPLQKLLLGV